MPCLADIGQPSVIGVHATASLDESVSTLAWCTGGTLLAGTAAGTLHHLDTAARTLATWPAHDGGITRIVVQPGRDDIAASAGEDGCVNLWDIPGAACRTTLTREKNWVEHLAWTPDGEVLACAAGRTISLWRNGEMLGMWYDAHRQVLALAWAPDGRRLASGANKGLYLWRLEDSASQGTEPMQLLSFPGAPVALAWKPDSRALAVGTQDGFLQIWLAADARHSTARQLTMRGYPGKVRCLDWHPVDPLIATAGGPDVVLWDLPAKGQQARGRPLRHHARPVTALCWSHGGQLLASADRDGRVCVWDRMGAAVFSRSTGHEISTLAWHPDDAMLAAGDTGGRIHLMQCLCADDAEGAPATS